MVMADFGDRDRGRRRRRRGFKRGDYHRGYRGVRENEDEEEEEYPPLQSPKTPIILAKPAIEKKNLIDVTNNHVIEKQGSATQVVQQNGLSLKSQDEPVKGRVYSNAQHSIPNLLANDTMPAHVYKERRTSAPVMIEGSIQTRLAPPPGMTHSMKLIDENLSWSEAPMEMLLDQTDFLIVGVLGLQGVGKSTLLSLLAGNTKDASTEIFKAQGKDAREVCSHQTVGVDMYVTGERMVLLDTQAMLSSSMLDCMINQDKKYSSDYSYSENCVEIQSLQVASFMLTVCHVVLVTMDWFADINFLRFIQSAEMLKPATPSGNQDNSHETEHHEYFPHMAFVVNKAGREEFDVDAYAAMQSTLATAFNNSKLQYKGALNMVDSKLMPKNKTKGAKSNVNLFLLPDFKEDNSKKGESILSLIPEYHGHHSFEQCFKKLSSRLFAMPRQLLTHTTLSEKNWFHYAARTWEGVKKSTLLSEYSRLLP